jgi:hypothetical protein
MTDDEILKVAVFEGKNIRKLLHKGEWWFSVIDIIRVLTGSSIPRRYWSDLKKKLRSEGFPEVYEKIVQLKMPSPDRKMRLTDCADTELAGSGLEFSRKETMKRDIFEVTDELAGKLLRLIDLPLQELAGSGLAGTSGVRSCRN